MSFRVPEGSFKEKAKGAVANDVNAKMLIWVLQWESLFDSSLSLSLV